MALGLFFSFSCPPGCGEATPLAGSSRDSGAFCEYLRGTAARTDWVRLFVRHAQPDTEWIDLLLSQMYHTQYSVSSVSLHFEFARMLGVVVGFGFLFFSLIPIYVLAAGPQQQLLKGSISNSLMWILLMYFFTMNSWLSAVCSFKKCLCYSAL